MARRLVAFTNLVSESWYPVRSVSDSLNIVVERCNHKSKQVQEQMETNENLSDQNAVSVCLMFIHCDQSFLLSLSAAAD